MEATTTTVVVAEAVAVVVSVTSASSLVTLPGIAPMWEPPPLPAMASEMKVMAAAAGQLLLGVAAGQGHASSATSLGTGPANAPMSDEDRAGCLVWQWVRQLSCRQRTAAFACWLCRTEPAAPNK
jgi:hypothetical protein